MNTNIKTVIIRTTTCNGFQIAADVDAWPDYWRSFGYWDRCSTELIHFNGRFYLQSGALNVEVPASSVVREILDEGKLGEWRTVAEILEEKQEEGIK